MTLLFELLESLPFRFDRPGLLLLILLAIPIVMIGRWGLGAMDPLRRWTSIGLRLALLLVITLMAAGLQTVHEHRDLTVVAVVDRSASVSRLFQPPADPETQQTLSYEGWVRQTLEDAVGAKRTDDALGIVTFSGRPRVTALAARQPAIELGEQPPQADGTDAASAIRRGIQLFPPESNRRMVLYWDGNDTFWGPGVVDAARQAGAAGIPIDVVALDYQLDSEVMVHHVIAPQEAPVNRTTSVRVVMRATQPTPGRLFLSHDGEVVSEDGGDGGRLGKQVTEDDWVRQDDEVGGRFTASIDVPVTMDRPGVNRFEATFQPEEGYDTIAENNRASAFTLVAGRGRVLVVDEEPDEGGQVLARTLARRGMDVAVRRARAMPSTMQGMRRYDAIVLQNVAAEVVSPRQQRLLASYVNDGGGGLIMVGGPYSFGAGGWQDTPVDRIMPVESHVPDKTVLPSGALVLVLDQSGSMAGPSPGTTRSRQEVANEAAVLATRTLLPQDYVGVVAFDHESFWISDLGLYDNPERLESRIRRISPRGGTRIDLGLREGYEALKQLDEEDAAVRHIILMSDGVSLPPEEPWEVLFQRLREANITVSTVGVGTDVDHQIMHQIAQSTGGQYHFVRDTTRLPQIFITEATTIRRNLIKEVEFTPQPAESSPLTRGLDPTPPLGGFVLTGARDDPRVVNAWVGPEGEPIFSYWQVGLGRAAAFTSDATSRWAGEWIDWPGYASFWNNVIEAVARPGSDSSFALRSHIRHNELHVALEAFGSGDDMLVDGLVVEGSVMKPDGSTESIELVQTGPGRYAARRPLPADEPGDYIVTLAPRSRDGSQMSMVFGGATRRAGEEFGQFRADLSMLRQVAEESGGRFFEAEDVAPATFFDRETVVPIRSLRPLWWPLLIAAIALFWLDVACRRIAWRAEGLREGVANVVDSIAGLVRPRGGEPPDTLGRLRQRNEQVERRLAPRYGTQLEPAISQSRREESGLAPGPAPRPEPAATYAATASASAPRTPTVESQGAVPAAATVPGDVARGGGAQGESRQSRAEQEAEAPPPEDGPTTSRLLHAKRRAASGRGGRRG